MGTRFTDSYSLLHFAVGILFYFLSVNFWWSVGLHVAFEIIENFPPVVKMIDNSWIGQNIWPGGKKFADAPINSVGDTVYFALGWILAFFVCTKGKQPLKNILSTHRPECSF
jgi:hypothetical protein